MTPYPHNLPDPPHSPSVGTAAGLAKRSLAALLCATMTSCSLARAPTYASDPEPIGQVQQAATEKDDSVDGSTLGLVLVIGLGMGLLGIYLESSKKSESQGSMPASSGPATSSHDSPASGSNSVSVSASDDCPPNTVKSEVRGDKRICYYCAAGCTYVGDDKCECTASTSTPGPRMVVGRCHCVYKENESPPTSCSDSRCGPVTR
jgi:hypothetical protein